METVQWILRYPAWSGLKDLDLSLPERAGRIPTILHSVVGLIQEGRWEEALASIQEARRSVRPPSLLAVLEAQARLGKGEVEKALRLLRSVEGSPTGVYSLALAQRSLIRLTWNEVAEARKLAEDAVARSPRLPAARLALSRALRGSGDLGGAYREAKACLRSDPLYLPALLQAAEVAFGLEREEEALAYLSRARSVAPGCAQAFMVEGFIRLARGEEKTAESCFTKALERDPLLGEVMVGLGILNMRRGEEAEALMAFLSAVLLEPQISLNRSYLAKALYQMGRWEEALKVLDRAAQLDPKDPTPHLYRALILRDLHRPGEAVRALEKALELNGGRCVHRSRFLLDQDRAVSNVNLAEAFRELGLLRRAQDRALQSVRSDPTNGGSHLFLSSAYLSQGRTRAGLRELLRARLLMPVNVNTFNTFRDYTLMFEGARVQGEVEAGVGEHDTWKVDLFLHGGTGPVAGALLLHQDETRGYHSENHGERNRQAYLDGKWILLRGHELLVHGEALFWAQGDRRGDGEAHWVPDPFLHQEGTLGQIGLGYRWRRRPREEVLIYGLWNRSEGLLKDRVQEPLWGGWELRQDLRWRTSGRLLQVGGVHMGRSGQHHWEWGLHWGSGEETLRRRELLSLVYGGRRLLSVPWTKRLRVRPAYANLHVGDTWKVRPRFFLEGSLFLHWHRWGAVPPVYSSRTMRLFRVGGGLGWIWSLSSRDTLRVGVFQYMEPPFTVLEGLQPAEVAGFPLGEDTAAGTWNREVRAAWDRSWSRDLHTCIQMGWKIRRSWEQTMGAVGFQALDVQGWDAGASLEWLILPGLALSARYGYRWDRVEEVECPPGVWPEEAWSEHRATLDLRWIHSSGWRVHVRQTGVLQMGELGRLGDRQEATWTDLLVERYLWGRRLRIRLEGRNLLNLPFRLRTRDLVPEKGRPVREIFGSVSLRF
jgi:tetratricopeptide (TPR) repeat protein